MHTVHKVTLSYVSPQLIHRGRGRSAGAGRRSVRRPFNQPAPAAIQRFSTDGRLLVSAEMRDRDWFLFQWDLTTDGALEEGEPFPFDGALMSSINGMDGAPGGTLFAFAAHRLEGRGARFLWDLETGESAVGDYETTFAELRFSPDGRWLASTAYDNTVVLWRASSAAPAHMLLSGRAGLDPIAWSADGRFIAAGERGGRILVWQVP